MHDDDETEDAFEEAPSKSELKRRMTALQELGETLTRLSEKELQRIPIDDEELRIAIAEVQKMRTRSARRRHMQLIGKIMRDVDVQPIEAALNVMRSQRRQQTDDFHALEELREQVLSQGLPGVERVIEKWPQADRQHLRQLVLQHQREVKKAQPPAASRKLFKYLRELQSS